MEYPKSHRNLIIIVKTSYVFIVKRISDIWSVLGKKGLDVDFLFSRSLLSPATCCLVNPDRDKTVEKAFRMIKHLSERLRDQRGL